MAEEVVLDYCRARERYMNAQNESRDERSSSLNAQRTIGSLLRESMRRNGMSYVPFITPSGEHKYVHDSVPRVQHRVLRTIDDVVTLVDGVAQRLSDVEQIAIPDAVSRIIEEKARVPSQNQDRETVRLRIVNRPGRNESMLDAECVPRETRQLTDQYATVYHDRQTARASLKPLRTTLKKAEENLTRTMQLGDTQTVRVQRPGQAEPVRIRLNRGEKRVARRTFGIRLVCRVAKEAAEGLARDDNFEPTLRDRIRALLEQELQQTTLRSIIRVRSGRVASAES